MNYKGNYSVYFPVIGSGRSTSCGDIVIDKSDVEINYISANLTVKAMSPAIGPCYSNGPCGDVTITLKDGQTKSTFWGKITMTDMYGNTFSDGEKVVYAQVIQSSPFLFDDYGSKLTWLNSDGTEIIE